MTVNVGTAISAYARQAGKAMSGGMEPRSADPGQSFGELLGESVQGAIDSGRIAEKATSDAIKGKADLNEVVAAVNNAEITLQTVLAVRDRVIQAYQDIVRMPI